MQALTPVAPHIVNLADHEAAARRVLDDVAWAYLCGAAADQLTHQANAQAWQDIRLRPRVLQPLHHSHTRVKVLGHTLPHPLLVAPMAYQRLAHPDGERATALAASAQQAGLVLSTQASCLLEDVAQVYQPGPASAPLWLQLYLQPRREDTLALVARAEAAGYQALVLTVDAPVHGVRDQERRTGFALPPGIRAVNLPGKPPPAALADLLAQAPTWDDVRWLTRHTRLPVLLKGILHPDDARMALDHGAAGVIVSNHGGRTLDTALPTAHALPAIAQAVGQHLSVLVDGGVRRGTDVFKALSLGAHAVLVGRPVLHGLAHAGAMGVAHVIRQLLDEFQAAMALCGVSSPEGCTGEHLYTPPLQMR